MRTERGVQKFARCFWTMMKLYNKLAFRTEDIKLAMKCRLGKDAMIPM